MKPKLKKQPEGIPGALDERGFYYGWVILAAGTVGIIMSVPGQTMGVSVYTNHLLASLPIDRVQLSFAYLLGTMSSAFLLPMVGRLLDRLGARVLGTAASVPAKRTRAPVETGPRRNHRLRLIPTDEDRRQPRNLFPVSVCSIG